MFGLGKREAKYLAEVLQRALETGHSCEASSCGKPPNQAIRIYGSVMLACNDDALWMVRIERDQEELRLTYGKVLCPHRYRDIQSA